MVRVPWGNSNCRTIAPFPFGGKVSGNCVSAGMKGVAVMIALEPCITRKKLFDGDGEALIESLFDPGDFTARVRLCARITLPAGASIGYHVHRDEDEIYYILSGSGQVSDGVGTHPVGPGSALLTRSGEGHGLANSGEGDLVLLAVIPLHG